MRDLGTRPHHPSSRHGWCHSRRHLCPEEVEGGYRPQLDPLASWVSAEAKRWKQQKAGEAGEAGDETLRSPVTSTGVLCGRRCAPVCAMASLLGSAKACTRTLSPPSELGVLRSIRPLGTAERGVARVPFPVSFGMISRRGGSRCELLESGRTPWSAPPRSGRAADNPGDAVCACTTSKAGTCACALPVPVGRDRGVHQRRVFAP
jgi:hypothetical protein